MGCTGSKAANANDSLPKCTKELKEIFKEDLNLFLKLPNDIQNKMILDKLEAGDRSIKGPDVIKGLFAEADANADGFLDLEEWKVFSAKLKEKMVEKYGASYDLTEE